MYKPGLGEVEELAKKGNMIPIYCELPADLETPVSVYLKLQDEGSSFLLESITGGSQVARYSFIGVRPQLIMSVINQHVSIHKDGQERNFPLPEGKDPLAFLKEEMGDCQPVAIPGLPRVSGGAVGFLGYDAVRRFENLPATAQDDLALPEAAFMLSDTLVAFDHVCQKIIIMVQARLESNLETAYRRATARIDEIIARLRAPVPDFNGRFSDFSHHEKSDPGKLTSNFTRGEFERIVEQAKEHILAGDIFQVVLSQRLSGTTSAQPFDIYRALRQLNPSPYMVFIRFPGGLNTPPLHVISGSPEMHVRLENGVAEVRPIAGTRPRGKNTVEDNELAEEMLKDEKERAEHIMLVDLGRNDLGRVCEYGSIELDNTMTVERYSHVMHMVSDVRGKLLAGKDAFDLLRATFPAGTVSGAPKVRAMEIIEELEKTRRGIYAGAIGYIGYDGNMDSCIAIRTIIMQGDQVHLQAGAGIVADSIPGKEFEETLHKAKALSESVRLAEKED